jgi:hypothetical protein
MKALTLAALLILGSTAAFASNLSKWQALQKKYGPDAYSVSGSEALDKAKVLCLCYDASELNNRLGFFTHYDGGANSTSLGTCQVPTSFHENGALATSSSCAVFDALGR